MRIQPPSSLSPVVWPLPRDGKICDTLGFAAGGASDRTMRRVDGGEVRIAMTDG